nr:MAG TPA: YopX protein [Caudoviricetes sp.]
MRKIKYRAYAKEYNKIVQVDRLGLNSDGSVQEILFSYKELGEDSNEWTDLQAGQFELLEFTGQYDKEGKEIYTGYILQFSNGNLGKVICHLRAGFDVAFSNAMPEELDHSLASRCKVVGNIYENKELLDE